MSGTAALKPTRDGTAQAGPESSGPVMTVGQYLIDRLAALGVEHVFGIPGDYVLRSVQDARGQPDPAGGHDPRGQRRVRRRRLRPDPRPGLRLRDLLRGRAEHLQQHRRGLRREVAGDRPERLAGLSGAGAQPAACTTRSRSSRRSSRSSRRSRWPRRCSTTRDGVQRDRPRARGRRAVQAAGLPGAPPRPGPRPAGRAAPAARGPAAERPRCAPRGARRGRRAAASGASGR